jgi:hypothetical protein
LVDDVPAALVSNAAPPDEAAYQRNTPDVAEVAVKLIVPVPQRSASVAAGADGSVLMVAITALRLLVTQVPLSKST